MDAKDHKELAGALRGTDSSPRPRPLPLCASFVADSSFEGSKTKTCALPHPHRGFMHDDGHGYQWGAARGATADDTGSR